MMMMRPRVSIEIQTYILIKMLLLSSAASNLVCLVVFVMKFYPFFSAFYEGA